VRDYLSPVCLEYDDDDCHSDGNGGDNGDDDGEADTDSWLGVA
jgi:hypothetical protein